MKNELKADIDKLSRHLIYSGIEDMDDLRVFMSIHVFAVWDFMSLAKRLQRSLTCVELPWQDPKNSAAAHLINEIIFYEESDVNLDGEPVSHVGMYLEAMEEIGADTSEFHKFTAALAKGVGLQKALDIADVPTYVKRFVSNNVNLAIHGADEEVAANFLYGREDAIPEMFTQMLNQWGLDENAAPRMTYYLKRHIDLDGDEHGPAAHKILEQLIDGNERAHLRAKKAAQHAIADRIRLWNGILHSIAEEKAVLA
jgi:hypothetical protein